MKRIWILIPVICLLWAGCRHHDHPEQEAPLFTITKPVRKDTLLFKEYVCQIRAIQHIELRALERGYLQRIYVDEGQTVKEGQLLFQIMPVVYQAEMKKAQAEVSFAEIEYLNTKVLADSNIVSQNELALLRARLEKARAELALAQAHLKFTEIRAPFNGIVGRFNNVRLGSLVEEGELLTTLSDNSKMWVYFNVPETEYLEYASRPKFDKPLQVKLQLANNQLFREEGIVETIEADFNNETGNIAFRATFKNPTGILRNGETGNILMPVYLNDALIIPQKATFEILDKKFVFVVTADSVVHSREIRIDTEMPHLYTVADGLQETDRILVEGLRRVKNGQKIKYDFVDLQRIMKELHQLHVE